MPGGAVRGASPKRVAFYTDAKAWGGAEVYLTQLARGLDEAGWCVTLFTSDRRATDAWVEDNERIGIGGARFRPTRVIDRGGFREALRLFKGFELVHFNKTSPRTCLPGIPAARRAGARIVVSTEHIAAPPESRYPFRARQLTHLIRRANRLLDRIIVVSNMSRRTYIESYEADPSRILTIHNGVDLSRFTREPGSGAPLTDLGLEVGDSVAVVIGRLCAGKGHETALAAAPAICEKVPRFKLLIVGSGPLQEELKRQAQERGVADAVVFAGFRGDVPALLAACDLLMLPSDAESLPLSVLEAMAAGLPVVATDVGGISEAVDDGTTGVLVAPGDPAALAAAAVGVLASPQRSLEMGRAGRAKVEGEFSVGRCIRSVISLYEELLAAKAEGPTDG